MLIILPNGYRNYNVLTIMDTLYYTLIYYLTYFS